MTHDLRESRPNVLVTLDDLDVGSPPVRDIVDAGRSIKRRRRLVMASVAAVTALIIGGAATTQLIGSNETDSLVADEVPTGATANSQDLTVDVAMADGEDVLVRGAATWNADSLTLTYVSHLSYSSSCRPEGTSTQNGNDVSLDLSVAVAATGGEEVPCTADDRVMIATISGLAEIPSEFSVTEYGRTRVVRVTAPGANERALPARTSSLS